MAAPSCQSSSLTDGCLPIADSKTHQRRRESEVWVARRTFTAGCQWRCVVRDVLRGSVLALVVGLALVPRLAYAQASVAGVVKDASGAVLPGVTVEAASPALIEKVRSAVTDGSGQYKIEALRPGVYTVTFTLAGFATLRREGIELSGSFAATVNADLKVGALEET